MVTTPPTQQTGPYVGNPTSPGTINFGLGQPSPRLLPLELIAGAATQLGQADRLVLQYGATQGFDDFREALAGFLSREHGLDFDPACLATMGAISLSLSLLSDVLGRDGRGVGGEKRRAAGLVACEDPTYFLACRVFRSAGLRTMGVPVDDEGMVVDALASRIAAGERPDFVYVIPTFQNPTGVTLSAARQRALLELAQREDFVVVADEPYNLLDFRSDADDAARSPAPLASHPAAGDHVVSVSSFTKILAPGLRTGWWQASSPALMRRLLRHGTLQSGGNLNPVMAQLLLPLLTSGALSQNVAKLRKTLSLRCEAMCEAVSEHLAQVTFRQPAGGYFLWLKFPSALDTRELFEAAKRHGVGFVAGPRCAVEAELTSCARLSFAFYEPEEIAEGIRRLGAAVADMT